MLNKRLNRGDSRMNTLIRGLLVVAFIAVASGPARADEYTDTVALFKNAGKSAAFFPKTYGYAVFPTIGKGGFIVGAAHGSGRVYAQGKYMGDTSMTQVSVGFQAGGQAYSEIIFFEDRRSLEEFTSGNFEFSADAGAVAITAGASGSAGTAGTTGTASGGEKDAATAGSYYKGMAVFTIAKGGLMYQAAIGGQKFSYKPVGAS
jgi:lipid-binding SYLF domain-containing protein